MSKAVEKYFEVKLHIRADLNLSEIQLRESLKEILRGNFFNVDIQIEDEIVIHKLEPDEIGMA